MLLDKFREPKDLVGDFIEELIFISDVVFPTGGVHVIRDDPSDDLVLETALLGDALVIVTGDHHLLTFGTFGDINIVRATEL